MTLEGTVVNGMVVLDAGARLPEGARVRVELADEDDDLFPPPEPYDREKELAILRQSLEDVKAGRGVEARQALADLARKHGLPLEPGRVNRALEVFCSVVSLLRKKSGRKAVS